MKPKFPLTQPFDQLPEKIPLYLLENALLPGGELPLEMSDPAELALFFNALRTDQLVGMIQPKANDPDNTIYKVGCAGRIRQYRERKDGRINVMLTGVCRYRILEEIPSSQGYRQVVPRWAGFEQDYETPDVAPEITTNFMTSLRDYFQRHQMQVDWNSLNKAHIEEVVNNLVLVMNFSTDIKQQLLESSTIHDRIDLFTELLQQKETPIWTENNQARRVN